MHRFRRNPWLVIVLGAAVVVFTGVRQVQGVVVGLRDVASAVLVCLALWGLLWVNPAVVWALAVQTFRRCVRRKVLFVLVLFVATILVGSHVMPSHDPEKRLQLLIVLCLYSISFYGIIVAVFLSATVLPEDRTDMTISTVLTKPVGRFNYILGRIGGFALTLGVILLVMGAVSWGFIRWGGREAAQTTGRDDLLIGKRGIDPSHVDLRAKTPTPDDDDDSRRGVLRGSADRVLVFHFRSGLDRLTDADNQTVELTPYISTGMKLPNTPAEIVVSNPVTGERVQVDRTLDSDRTTAVTFPRRLISAGKGVDVTVRRLKPAYVRFTRGAIRLMTTPVPFEWSYFKSLVMIFLGFMLVVIVSITASTFLSAWVAVMVGFVAYFFAEFQEVLLDFMAGLRGEAVGWLGTEAFKHVHSHGGVAEVVTDPWYVIAVNRFFYGCLWVLTHVFPDFDRFDASSFLTSATDVPRAVVGTAGYVLAAYGVCYLILGHVVFWRRELLP